jgi:hypothetical protein
MAYELRLTQEELDELRQSLRCDLDETHDELRRTRNIEYKEQVKHHLGVIDRLMKMVETARCAEHVGVS